MTQYNIGQVVRVDFPRTYGTIVGFSPKQSFLGSLLKNKPEPTGVKIEYMKPVNHHIKTSVYRFEGYFSDKLHVINPAEELAMIRKDGRTPNGAPLEESVEFLSRSVGR